MYAVVNCLTAISTFPQSRFLSLGHVVGGVGLSQLWSNCFRSCGLNGASDDVLIGASWILAGPETQEI